MRGFISVIRQLGAQPDWAQLIDRQMRFLAEHEPGPGGRVRAAVAVGGIAGAVGPAWITIADQDLLGHIERGRLVVANLSRRAIGPAALAFPRLAIAEIAAPRAVLIERIVARGRETRPDAEARVAREAPIEVPGGLEAHRRIDNGGALDEATAAFLAFLSECR